MKIYLLVEGEKTEMKLYPSWFSYLLPELKMVNSFKSNEENSYFLFCGQGIPSIYNHAANAIKDINSRLDLSYDYLIVCLDGENLGTEGRKNKLFNFLKEKEIELLGKCKLRVIIQNACVETWFLGNRKVIKTNPEGEFLNEYLQHYNVKISDPELMPNKEPFKIKAQFHESYLREVLKEHSISYRKAKPKEVLEKTYMDELLKRTIDSPTHLASLKEFFILIDSIRQEMDSQKKDTNVTA